MIISIILIIFLFFSPYLFRFYSQMYMRHRCKKNGYLVLSFDDGPGFTMTPVLLDLLERNNVSATFFILGSKVEGNESIIERMILLGHEIGCHGYHHINAWKTTPWKANRDIANGLDTLSKFKIKCRLFRPPYGKIHILNWIYIRYKGLTTCWWTDVSGDTFAQLPCPKLFAENVLSKGGGVVLMHDFDRQEERTRFVLLVIIYLIEGADKHRLRFVKLGELLQQK